MRAWLNGFYGFEVETADDGAFLSGDFADGAQRDEVAAAREGFVDLRDVDGAHADSTERDGRVVADGVFRARFVAEALQGVGDVFDANIKCDARGRDVVGADERFLQGNFAVVALVVVFRRPGFATGFVVKRAVIERGGEGVELRVFERGQIHHGFDDGADVAQGVEGAVVALFVWHTRADNGQHFGVAGVDDDSGALQEVFFQTIAFFQGGQGAGQGILGFLLDERVKGGEDVEAVFGEVFFFVVFTELLVNEVNKGGEAHPGSLCIHRHDVKRQRLRELHVGFADEVVLLHKAEHHVAPLQGVFGVAARVGEAGFAHEADKHGDFVQAEVFELFVEVVFAGKAKAMDGALTVLAEVDFVEIAFEDVFFAVVVFEDERHQHFFEFARQGLFVGEVVVFDELLGEGTGTLFAGFLDVGDVDGASEAARVYAGVAPEVFVFDGDQAVNKHRRHVFEVDQYAVLFARRVDAGDVQRFEAFEDFFFEGAEVLYAADFVIVELHLHPPCRTLAVPEVEGLGVVFDGVAFAMVLLDVVRAGDFAVVEQFQFVDEVFGGKRRALVEFKRAGVHARRHGPQRSTQFAVIKVVLFFEFHRVHEKQHAAEDAEDDQEVEGVTDEA